MATEIQGSLISELSSTTINGTEKIPVEKGLGNNSITTKLVKDYVKDGMKTSDLTNDSHFATENYVTTKIADAQLGGGDVDTSNLATKDDIADMETKTNAKATYQPKGNYLTQHQSLTDYAKKSDIKTKTSELTNDSNFVVDAHYNHTDCNYTQAEKQKLANLKLDGESNLPLVDVDTQFVENLLFDDYYIKINKFASECGEPANGYYTQDGKFTSDERYSNIILPVKGLEKIKFSLTEDPGKDTYVFVFTDKDKNVIPYEEFKGPYGGWILPKAESYDIPYGVEYLKVSGSANKLSILKIEGYAYTPMAKANIKSDYNKIKCSKRLIEAPFIEEDVINDYSIDSYYRKIISVKGRSIRFINISDVYKINIKILNMTDRDRYGIDYWSYDDYICTEEYQGHPSLIDVLDIPPTATYISISSATDKIKNIKVYLEYNPSKLEKRLLTKLDYNVDSSIAYARSGNVKFMTGVHLDCGRKYFSESNIKKLIDEIAAAKLGYLQLHFCENQGFRFGLDDMNVSLDGINTVDLTPALGDSSLGGDGSNKWLTLTEMTNIISYADSKNVEIIPAFDMPAEVHLKSIDETLQEIAVSLEKEKVLYTNIGRYRLALMIHLNLLKKYALYFKSQGCRFFNICSDEVGYNDITLKWWANFTNSAIRVILEVGMSPIIYNDILCYKGILDPFINNGVIVMCWRENELKKVIKGGYRTINCSPKPYYFILNKPTSEYDSASVAKQIKEHNINKYGNLICKDNFGVFFLIWCDNAAIDGADNGDGVIKATAPLIQALGDAISSHL